MSDPRGCAVVIRGFARPDGGFGIRNLLLVVSALDLANDVAIRIAQMVPEAVAVLTPAGGASMGDEAALIDRLRRRLCHHPNVGAVVAMGPTAEALDALAEEARAAGRQAATLCLLDCADSVDVVARGVRCALEMARALSARPRDEGTLADLCVGLRSSSSSLHSARTVNPAVGRVVDRIVGDRGTVCFGEAADLAGVAEAVADKAISPDTASDIRRALAARRELLVGLAAKAPDPTPTNRSGGIATLEQKGEGALRRLGGVPIRSVVGFGEPLPGPGLHMMDGPGSAAVCLLGLAAAGCALIVYTVGLTSVTAAMPLAPVLKIGPDRLRGSLDVDLIAGEDVGDAPERLFGLLRTVASGAPSASERLDRRQVMLAGWLPPL